ncbi:thioredoxin-dependent thiol peroxidase [Elizabethkingia argentiflava]|uniref:thioredoxin-dependent peroxiredoxin n=1 Tax=Elizabethkingia argenteiflava TaxID=2681556 RepID=A0A845PRZ9_9FLAO|nr:thioredoxin-dependent thiol peroxidase [Elizabethkingia argenteiflava]NAW50614.1 thioredoxin-dependent thiol peroxidase [Elizabethkingia argenteiflava]
MLGIGDKLPDFKAINQYGEQKEAKDYRGKKLIVFFYPKANTPGCTAEACNLKDHYETLKQQGYYLLGVSADDEKSQRKFSDKYNFPFELLADTDRVLIDAFGVWQLKKFMGREFMGILRTTFVFDEHGACEKVISKVKTKEHAQQLLED